MNFNQKVKMNNPVLQSFFDGMAFYFGADENPIEKYYRDSVRKRQERNNGLSGWEIDARNLRGDWERVGMYLKNAFEQYEQETASIGK